MASKAQMTGMRGVYLVASELTRCGLIATPTSRSAAGADILVTNKDCSNTFSVQVKTNARTFNFWLVGKKIPVSPSHVYVLVNIRPNKGDELIEYFIVPSKVIAEKTKVPAASSKGFDSFRLDVAEPFRDKWDIFSKKNN
ncbi:MAG: hypothetical protein H7836_15990 [Magnetococcus sp. YQC-3]